MGVTQFVISRSQLLGNLREHTKYGIYNPATWDILRLLPVSHAHHNVSFHKSLTSAAAKLTGPTLIRIIYPLFHIE
jgi:hypothetical protein